MCDPITFANISPSNWATIEAQAKFQSVDIETSQGTEMIGPASMKWDYEESTQTLTVQCLSKPWYISCNEVNLKIRELFAQWTEA